jgi:NADPH-dependent glutamate synthase beta subunit-like oxidoreductase
MEETDKPLERVEALLEAERCLYCFDAPCEKACPANVPIPEFIHSIKTNNLQGAREIIEIAHPLIETCGRICPEESFCQSACIRAEVDSPIKIRELHRYVTDNTEPSRNLVVSVEKKGRVAIVGGGPAGLSCARELRRMGFETVIFEKKELGGIPMQQVSKTRFPESVGKREVRFINDNFVTEVKDKKIQSIKEIRDGFDAIFIATGLQEELDLDIKGKNLKGVYFAAELLKFARASIKTPVGKRVGVIGGGNVAVEVATVLKQENNERDVELVYRRGLKELKAFKDEIDEAVNVGVTMQFLAIPIEIKGNGFVEGIVVRRARLSKPDASGRRNFEEIPNSDFFIPLDTIVIAIGQKPADYFEELEKTDKGLIKVDYNFMTSVKGVFAGGDIVKGASTIVESVAQGKKAALSIANYLNGGKNV